MCMSGTPMRANRLSPSFPRHGVDIMNGRIEGEMLVPVREPGASTVEADEAPVGGKPFGPGTQLRNLPFLRYMTEGHDVDQWG